jgi:hypothetical protein
MRRGEVVGLTRKMVNLRKRMIYLGPDDVKEGQWKRVPIHVDLVPILEEVMKVQAIGKDHVFLHNDEPVTHRDQLRWCWDRKSAKAGLDPHPYSFQALSIHAKPVPTPTFSKSGDTSAIPLRVYSSTSPDDSNLVGQGNKTFKPASYLNSSTPLVV